MFSSLSKFILKLLGYTISGECPALPKKKVVIAGPHTSYWDFPIGIMVRSAGKLKTKYVGKASLFKPPLGWIMKFLGGIPVDRTKSNNFVDAVVAAYNERDELAVLFAPEGTRRKVDKLKTGFYYVAKEAGIPIVPVIFDIANKSIRWLPMFYPGDNPEEDLLKIQKLFDGVEGFYPENSIGYGK